MKQMLDNRDRTREIRKLEQKLSSYLENLRSDGGKSARNRIAYSSTPKKSIITCR